jgi:hypothetical protein
MSTYVADSASNPYASPSPVESLAPAEAATPAPGSLAIIFPGFLLLFVGYITSNLFLIGDLYHLSIGPNDQAVASPFSLIAHSPLEQWLLYTLCAMAFVAGAVMVGSQRLNPAAIVCYVMCPIVGAVFMIGSPLRIAVKHAEIVATLYLLVGSCLAFTGIAQLLRLYQQANNGFDPIVASMMTEAGLALLIGAGLKFWRMPRKATGTVPGEATCQWSAGS